MTTKAEPKKPETCEQVVQEADMKARFLLSDITTLLDKVPDEALPDVNEHLKRALDSARDAMETKKRESEKRLK